MGQFAQVDAAKPAIADKRTDVIGEILRTAPSTGARRLRSSVCASPSNITSRGPVSDRISSAWVGGIGRLGPDVRTVLQEQVAELAQLVISADVDGQPVGGVQELPLAQEPAGQILLHLQALRSMNWVRAAGARTPFAPARPTTVPMTSRRPALRPQQPQRREAGSLQHHHLAVADQAVEDVERGHEARHNGSN